MASVASLFIEIAIAIKKKGIKTIDLYATI